MKNKYSLEEIKTLAALFIISIEEAAKGQKEYERKFLKNTAKTALDCFMDYIEKGE